MKYTDSICYFRDGFLSAKDANLNIASSPVLYGLSVYTVFAATWNKSTKELYVFRLKDHFKRLKNSANIMDFDSFVSDWTYEKFEKIVLELLKRNAVEENVLVRATVFIDEIAAGTKIHGLKNSLSVYAYPMGEILPRNGIHACVSSWQRTADNAIPSRAKINGSYANASLMKNEALLNGYDEAISVDKNGHVCEGTVANICIVRDGQLITPDPATDILEGITRDTILRLSEMAKIPTIQRSIARSELYVAEEVFMCGSSAQITPVLSIDRRQIADGKSGPITEKLKALLGQLQNGSNKNFSEWTQKVV
ncbi:MAG: aminotransferase class IV [Candidatus Saccharibacteria bacterium]